MQDLLLAIIGEVYIVEDHIPYQRHQLVLALWTWMFPSPTIGLLVGDN